MNLREVQPTIFFAVPRIWERIHAGVLIRLQDATRLQASSSHRLGLTSCDATSAEQRAANNGNFTVRRRRLAYWVG